MRRVAIVTGASAGIGYATAERLLRDGYSVVATARRRAPMDRLKGAASAGNVLVIPGDIADPRHCRTIVQRAAEWGRLEVVVANAGRGYVGPFELITDEEMRHIIDVNLFGVMHPIREAIPIMKANGGGKIVIVGSVLSRIATSGNAVYCAAKHAVVGLADSLRFELRPHGIRVISVLPGYTATEFFDVMIRKGERSVEKVRKYFFFDTAERVANVIARRIEHPKAEVVVGAINTAGVFFGTRFPSLYRFAVTAFEKLLIRKAGN